MTSKQSSSLSPIVVGIAGGSGSGKTTVVHRILDRVGWDRIAYLPHDAYYKDASHLPWEERIHLNYDHPQSLDNDLLIEHIHRLMQGQPVDAPIYDFSQHIRSDETRRVFPSPVILVEGILVFVDERLRDLMDIKLYVDTAADIRFIRRLLRDINERGRTVQSVVEQYQTTVRPMHLKFVEPTKSYADIIIPEGGHNDVAMEMVIGRIETLLAEHETAYPNSSDLR
jgi:uridine kinase